MKPLIIAIDGPSASGKGTAAKKIASHFNLPYLNTGALYRFIALQIILQKINLENFLEELNFASKRSDECSNESVSKLDSIIKNISEDELENDDLFTESVGAVASVIAKNSLLRKKLLHFQKDFVRNSLLKGGAVLDGRDTTTVICENATHKFFITADVEIRALRRFNQLKNQRENISYEEILQQLKQRDANDLNRADSPLTISKDAIFIDNGNLSIDDVFKKMLKSIE